MAARICALPAIRTQLKKSVKNGFFIVYHSWLADSSSEVLALNAGAHSTAQTASQRTPVRHPPVSAHADSSSNPNGGHESDYFSQALVEFYYPPEGGTPNS
jgi:hypothetical protein